MSEAPSNSANDTIFTQDAVFKGPSSNSSFMVQKLADDLDKLAEAERHNQVVRSQLPSKSDHSPFDYGCGAKTWVKGTGFGGDDFGETEQLADSLACKAKAADEADAARGQLLESLSEAVEAALDPEPVMAIMAKSSGLSHTMQQLLRNECLPDVLRRSIVYSPLLSLLDALAKREGFWPQLLAPLHSDGWGWAEPVGGAASGEVGVVEGEERSDGGRCDHGKTVGALVKGLQVQAKLFEAMCERGAAAAQNANAGSEGSEANGEEEGGGEEGGESDGSDGSDGSEEGEAGEVGEEGTEGLAEAAEEEGVPALCLRVQEVAASVREAERRARAAAEEVDGGGKRKLGGADGGAAKKGRGEEAGADRRSACEGARGANAGEGEGAGGEAGSMGSEKARGEEEEGGEEAGEAGEAGEGAARYAEEMGERAFAAVALVPQIEARALGFAFPLSGAAPGGAEPPRRRARAPTRLLTPKGRTLRVASEVASLAASLPVARDAAIFVRVDETRPDVIKALITGPAGTPYAYGVFEFDVLLPADYPNSPPRVKLLTTGNGAVRFNPNLYSNGQVCLSLLGTWEGPGWDAQTSTLLQVLVSVQALIMVEDPYFNEPGFEDFMHSPSSKAASARYSAHVWANTVRHALLGAGRQPSAVFEDVILRHLALSRGAILRDCERWEAEIARQVQQASEQTTARGDGAAGEMGGADAEALGAKLPHGAGSDEEEGSQDLEKEVEMGDEWELEEMELASGLFEDADGRYPKLDGPGGLSEVIAELRELLQDVDVDTHGTAATSPGDAEHPRLLPLDGQKAEVQPSTLASPIVTAGDCGAPSPKHYGEGKVLLPDEARHSEVAASRMQDAARA